MTDKEFKNSDSNSIHRILDAAINRASEGLRVVEDYVRMIVQDEHLSQELKQLRHDLTFVVASVDAGQRIAARDTIGDVGCKIETDSEYDRGAGTDVGNSNNDSSINAALVRANLSRAQQALRTIEEFSKTIDASISKQVEQLRYRTYTIEKAVLTTVVSLENFSQSSLYVLIDGCGFETGDDSKLSDMVNSLTASKTDVIQLRDKTLLDKQLVLVARRIAELTRGTSTKLIINDRPDIAVAAGADGVHLGQDDLDVADARRIVGAARVIGVSTHSIEQARQAVLEGANYIGVGPVFPSKTKSFDAHVGLELVQEVANEIQLPAFAIGGIDLENVSDVLAAGLRRVAVSSAVAGAQDPGVAAKQFKQALDLSFGEGKTI